jgi:hypothetical protein
MPRPVWTMICALFNCSGSRATRRCSPAGPEGAPDPEIVQEVSDCPPGEALIIEAKINARTATEPIIANTGIPNSATRQRLTAGLPRSWCC